MNDPATSQVQRKTGLEAFERGDYRTAAYYLSGRVAAAPHDIEARCKLGASYSQLGHHAQALDLLSQVVRERPGQPEIVFHYGIALSRVGRAAEAEATFHEVLRLNPQHAGSSAWLDHIRRASAPSPGKLVKGTARQMGSLGCAWLLGRVPGLMLIPFLILLGPLLLVHWGVDGIRKVQEGPVLRTVTYQQVIASPPQHGWYRVTGCRVDCSRGGYQTWDTRGLTIPDVVFVPVYGTASTNADRAPLVLESTNLRLRRLMARVIAYHKGTDTTLAAEETVVPMDVEGVLSPPADLGPTDLRVVNLLRPILAPQYAILHDGEKPNLPQSIGMLVGGIIWGIIWIVGSVWLVRKAWKGRKAAGSSGT